MNVKRVLKIGLLAGMLALFFVSNGITGTEIKVAGCTSDGWCLDNGCSSGGSGNCCVGSPGIPCMCIGVVGQCSQ
jgi:hypothetical protein